MAGAYSAGEFTDKHTLIWSMTGGFVGLWLVAGLGIAFYVRAKTTNPDAKNNYCQ